jgi:hypothetical protein
MCITIIITLYSYYDKLNVKKIKIEEVKMSFELSDEQLFQACGGITCHK